MEISDSVNSTTNIKKKIAKPIKKKVKNESNKKPIKKKVKNESNKKSIKKKVKNESNKKVDETVKKEESTKTEVTKEKESVTLTKDLEAKIVRQVEYYFGDINLPKDKFLQQQISLDDGWVPLSVLLTFKRLVSLCSEEELIAQALMNSDNNLIMISDDHKKIRRNPEIPIPEYNEERRAELVKRTAYAKGFEIDDSLESLMKFFEPYGPIESIYMRTYKDKALQKNVFKRSVFVIFKTVDDCKSFLDKQITYKDTPLITKWQADYIEEKKKEREELNEKKKTAKDSKLAEVTISFPKGSILHVSGFSNTTTREDIKKAISKIFDKDPAYITYTRGSTEGYIRFPDENDAVDFVKKLTESKTKFKVNQAEITVRALEGEEEDKFLAELSSTISKIKHNNRLAAKERGRKRHSAADSSKFKAKRNKKS